MSLPSTVPRSTAVGNNTTGTYPWAWIVNQQSDLHVAVLSPLGSTSQSLIVLVLGTDYTVQFPATQIGSSLGGNIILTATGYFAFNSGNLPTGWSILIRRNVTFGQNAVIGNQSGYNPASVENALDYLAMQTIQLQDMVNHCIQIPIDDPGAVTQGIPVSSLRASGVVAFDSSGNPTVIAGQVPSASLSPYWAALVQLTTAAASRTSLGFGGTGGTVQTVNIDPNGLGAAAYAAGSVGTAALAANAVTAAKIASATITNTQIASNTILANNLDPSIGIFSTGDIKPTLSSSVPTGWLQCFGQQVSRTTYAQLFSAIGVSYGSGDGSTTFAIPDLRGRFLRGAGAANATGSGSVASNAATFTAHNFGQAMRVQLSSGTLSGLSASTNYWVIVVDSNTLKFSSTRANAIAGTADVVITGANSAVLMQWEDVGAASRVAGAPGGSTGNNPGTYEDEDVAPHMHTYGALNASKWGTSSGNVFDGSSTTGASTSITGTETRPRNVAVNWLIKT